MGRSSIPNMIINRPDSSADDPSLLLQFQNLIETDDLAYDYPRGWRRNRSLHVLLHAALENKRVPEILSLFRIIAGAFEREVASRNEIRLGELVGEGVMEGLGSRVGEMLGKRVEVRERMGVQSDATVVI